MGNISVLTDVFSLYIYSTSIDGNVSGIASMTDLTNLRANSTLITGDLTSVATLTSLDYLYLNSTSIDTYTTGALPAWGGCAIQIQDLGLSATEVDNFIIDLEDGGGNGDNGTLNIAGTNATRTSASDTAKANLETDGWTVTANNP